MEQTNYKTKLLEQLTPENAEQVIGEAIAGQERAGYRLVTLSFWGEDRAVLVFRKGLKGSLL